MYKFLKGLAVSGEYINAVIYLYEQQARDDMKNTMFYQYYAFGQGVLWCGGSGSIVSVIWKIILDAVLSDDQLYSYGWRIPFWFGFIIILCGFYVRRKLPDDDKDFNTDDTPITTVYAKHCQDYYQCLIIIFFVLGFPSTCHTISFYWFADYLADLHSPTDSQAYYYLVGSFICGLGFMAGVGYLEDRYNQLQSSLENIRFDNDNEEIVLGAMGNVQVNEENDWKIINKLKNERHIQANYLKFNIVINGLIIAFSMPLLMIIVYYATSDSLLGFVEVCCFVLYMVYISLICFNYIQNILYIYILYD